MLSHCRTRRLEGALNRLDRITLERHSATSAMSTTSAAANLSVAMMRVAASFTMRLVPRGVLRFKVWLRGYGGCGVTNVMAIFFDS